ncbi:MAG: hypothetical protein EOO22_08925, partial [Comamonadaceae bacterium]
MNRRLVAFALLALHAMAAQAQSQPASSGLDVEAERARIATERAALDQRSALARSACYQRFSVQSCLSDVQKEQRQRTDDLKRQEVKLNESERKRRGAAELERLEAQKKDVAETARRIEEAQRSQQQREQRAADRNEARERGEAAAPAGIARQRAREQAFADKQAKAAARRAR